MSNKIIYLIITAVSTLVLSMVSYAQYGTENGEWHYWGGDAGHTRYAPLDQINSSNAKELAIAWRWRAQPLDNRPDSNMKATPLMIDGVLYTPTGQHQVAAIDPASGKTLWLFTPPKYKILSRNLAASSRSLAYWTDGKEQRLFHNTLDGRLLSVNMKTGQGDKNFGQQGMVELRENLSKREVPFVGSTSPPLVVGNVVIAQVTTYITAPNKEAPPGFIRGFDVRTGKLLWTFHTIPQKGEFGNDTWENGSWKYTGNTGVWSMMSADLETGYVYLPVEAPTNDFYGGQRLGDNLFSQSLVCLDAKTGNRIWHFQMIHHGIWDYDPPAAPILGDITVNGKKIKAVTQLTKQGMSFVFDRITGEPVWPIEERAVPQSTVPGERTSPTQPFPTLPEYYELQGYSEDNLIDFTPELRAAAIKIAEQYVRGPLFTPISRVFPGSKTQGTWVNPGYGGGSNWNGGSFDPETGMMYVPTRNAPMIARLTPADPKLTNWDYIRADSMQVTGPQGLPINKPPYSKITATNMNTGKHQWWRAIGTAPESIRKHPALKGLDLDWDGMGYPNVRPVPMTTKSLFFMAESGNLSGDPGGKLFRAYDKSTGKTVAEIELPAKASGGPMTYMHEGNQYIVIAVATQEHPAELVALTLKKNITTPPVVNNAPPIPDTPTVPSDATITATPAQLANGKATFEQACTVCHGANGRGIEGGAPPLTNLSGFEQVQRAIIQGGVEMPPMTTLLTTEQIRDVSLYVLKTF